ncbi:MAG: hypothetical protein ACFFE4_07945 [Candidatus Thorarchaeota archaeon]
MVEIGIQSVEEIAKKLTVNNIVGIGIAGSNSYVYTWFKDLEVVIVGSSTDLGRRSIPYSYDLPGDVSGTDVVGVAIAKVGKDRDWCYAWYNNDMRTAGRSNDLDKRLTYRNFVMPAGKTVNDIVGMGISSRDFIYTWYKDGTRSYGTSYNLGKYQAPKAYTLASGKTPNDIAAMAIAPNDWCYVWYKDYTISAGSSTDLDRYQKAHLFKITVND